LLEVGVKPGLIAHGFGLRRDKKERSRTALDEIKIKTRQDDKSRKQREDKKTRKQGRTRARKRSQTKRIDCDTQGDKSRTKAKIQEKRPRPRVKYRVKVSGGAESACGLNRSGPFTSLVPSPETEGTRQSRLEGERTNKDKDRIPIPPTLAPSYQYLVQITWIRLNQVIWTKYW
jgi:hypothetical protein